MALTQVPAKMAYMATKGPDEGDLTARGERLEKRVKALKIPVAKLAKLANLGSRTTVYTAFKGEAELDTYRALEAALDEWESHPEDQERNPVAIASTDEGLIEFELTGVYGVERVVVRGPVANVDQLEQAAARIIRDLRPRLEEFDD